MRFLKLALISALSLVTLPVNAQIITYPTQAPSTASVASTVESRLRSGQAFVWSTGLLAIGAGNYLNVVFTNPVGSGKTIYIYYREYINSSANVLTFTNYINPSALTGTVTTKTGGNLNGNSSNTAVGVLTYNTPTTPISTGTQTSSDLIPPNATPRESQVYRAIAPGSSFGMSIGGVGGVFAAASNVAVSIAAWEE